MPNYTNWTRAELKREIAVLTNRIAFAKTEEEERKWKAVRDELVEELGERIVKERRGY